jgi:acyl-CoA synthetase (NDP forming)
MNDMDYIFHPRSIAIVGATSNPLKFGYGYMTSILDLGFKGKLYPINPKRSEVFGFKAYPSLRDAPRPIDYAISNIPARQVPQMVEDCLAAGVKILQLFTAGFSETGEDEGIRLEKEMVRIARKGEVRIIGPNCLGVYCPKIGLAFNGINLPKESGPVAFISQSGGNANELTNIGGLRGIRFSKVVSYGNACDLNETDFMEYLAHDPDTEIITAYIEGVKNGPGFARALREATRRKPVIMLKGGRTAAGTRAAASHTGALAGEVEVWDALCRQMGVLQVNSLDEMADLLLAFLYLSIPHGRNVGVIGLGGGVSVQAADDCEAVGLHVYPLPPEIRAELKKITPEAGTSIANPIDSTLMFSPEEFYKTITITASCQQIDLLIIHMTLEFGIGYLGGIQMMQAVADNVIRAGKKTAKPMAVVLRTAGSLPIWQGFLELRERFQKAGFPVFPTVASAALALGRFLQYHQNRDRNE